MMSAPSPPRPSASHRPAALLSAAAALVLAAGPAAGATLDYKENQVDVLPAAGGGTTLKTGDGSRAQLEVGRGVVRMGSKTETFLHQNGDRLDLKKGVMMVSSGRRGLRRDAVTVGTPVAEINAKATMLINYQPLKYIKISCIEGTVSVSLRSLMRDSVKIREGQVLVIHCLEDRAPKLMDIDLRRLLGTSALVGGRFPRVGRIDGRRTSLARGRRGGAGRPPPDGRPPQDRARPGGRRAPQTVARGRDRLPPSQTPSRRSSQSMKSMGSGGGSPSKSGGSRSARGGSMAPRSEPPRPGGGGGRKSPPPPPPPKRH